MVLTAKGKLSRPGGRPDSFEEKAMSIAFQHEFEEDMMTAILTTAQRELEEETGIDGTILLPEHYTYSTLTENHQCAFHHFAVVTSNVTLYESWFKNANPRPSSLFTEIISPAIQLPIYYEIIPANASHKSRQYAAYNIIGWLNDNGVIDNMHNQNYEIILTLIIANVLTRDDMAPSYLC